MIFENDLKHAVIVRAAATNFDRTGELAELQIIDAHTGAPHLNVLLKPAGEVNPNAIEAYGLADDFHEGAGCYTDYEARIKEILNDKMALMEDGTFTANLLIQTAQAFNRPTDWIENLAMAHRVDVAA